MCGCTKPPAQRMVTELELEISQCLKDKDYQLVQAGLTDTQTKYNELRNGIEKILAHDGDECGFRRCLKELLARIDDDPKKE